MKIYSLKTLIVTIVVGGAGLLYSIYRLHNEDLAGAAWLILFVAAIIKGIRISTSEKEYQKDMKNAQKRKTAYQTLFGKAALIMPYGSLICFIIATVLIYAFPAHTWIGMCFVIAALIYEIWLMAIIHRELDKETPKQ